MRYSPLYDRVYGIITDVAIPRLENGGIALCHGCQRSIMFANGFLNYLIRALEYEAKSANLQNNILRRYPHRR